MRESVGSTWIFSLVLAFTLIFAAFLVLSLTYSKAYKIKNEMTSIIQKYEGLTNTDALNKKGSITIINQYLANNNYTAKGTCEENDYAVDDLSSDSVVKVTDTSQKYFYCIHVDSYTQYSKCRTLFRIKVFYNFNLPVLGDLKQFSITGQTNEMAKAYINGSKLTC